MCGTSAKEAEEHIEITLRQNGDSLSAAYKLCMQCGSMQKKKLCANKQSSKSKRWTACDICFCTPVQDFFLVYVDVEICFMAPVQHSQYLATVHCQLGSTCTSRKMADGAAVCSG